MFESIILLSLIVLACFVIFSDNLRRSIIYLGIFSLLMAVGFLFYNAPDVALAEAAIGAGLSTVMYLIALKKISVYNICYVNEEIETFNDKHINEVMPSIIRPLELFIERTEEVEPQLSYTNNHIDAIIQEDNHECIIQRKGDLVYIYGNMSDQIFQDIIANLDEILPDLTNVRIFYKDEVTLNGTNHSDE